MQQEEDLPAVVHVEREMSVEEVVAQSMKIHHVLEAVMVNDIHYGVIPGTHKKTLYKAGAEKLCATFRLAPRYEVDDLSEPHQNIYRFRVKCSLVTIRDGMFVGSAMGEASTAEEKYQWELAVNEKHWEYTDPTRRRVKFLKDGTEILQVHRNGADLSNTVLKIACKRAFVSATKGSTAASDLLDVDLDEEAVADLKKQEEKAPPKPKPTASAPKIPFGNSKGKEITDPTVPVGDLEWMLKYVTEGLQKPERSKWKAQDEAFMKHLNTELDRRASDGSGPTKDAGVEISDEVWSRLTKDWAIHRKLDYQALKAELGIEHASKIAPEQRATFKQRMER